MLTLWSSGYSVSSLALLKMTDTSSVLGMLGSVPVSRIRQVERLFHEMGVVQ